MLEGSVLLVLSVCAGRAWLQWQEEDQAHTVFMFVSVCCMLLLAASSSTAL
jgi:hypothetical protein